MTWWQILLVILSLPVLYAAGNVIGRFLAGKWQERGVINIAGGGAGGTSEVSGSSQGTPVSDTFTRETPIRRVVTPVRDVDYAQNQSRYTPGGSSYRPDKDTEAAQAKYRKVYPKGYQAQKERERSEMTSRIRAIREIKPWMNRLSQQVIPGKTTGASNQTTRGLTWGIYQGDVEIVVASPANPSQVRTLQQYIVQYIPGSRIILSGGTAQFGYEIVIALSSPLDLVGRLKRIPIVAKVTRLGKKLCVELTS